MNHMNQRRFAVLLLIIIVVLIVGASIYYSYSKKNSKLVDSVLPSTQQTIYHDSKYKFYITLPKTFFDLNVVRNDPMGGDNIVAYNKDFSTNARGNWSSNDIGVTISISKDESTNNIDRRLKYINDGGSSDDRIKILELNTIIVGGVQGTELLINNLDYSFATTPYEFVAFFKVSGV